MLNVSDLISEEVSWFLQSLRFIDLPHQYHQQHRLHLPASCKGRPCWRWEFLLWLCFGGEGKKLANFKFSKGKGIKLIYVGVQLRSGFSLCCAEENYSKVFYYCNCLRRVMSFLKSSFLNFNSDSQFPDSMELLQLSCPPDRKMSLFWEGGERGSFGSRVRWLLLSFTEQIWPKRVCSVVFPSRALFDLS